jgi:hypothetical protein
LACYEATLAFQEATFTRIQLLPLDSENQGVTVSIWKKSRRPLVSFPRTIGQPLAHPVSVIIGAPFVDQSLEGS